VLLTDDDGLVQNFEQARVIIALANNCGRKITLMNRKHEYKKNKTCSENVYRKSATPADFIDLRGTRTSNMDFNHLVLAHPFTLFSR